MIKHYLNFVTSEHGLLEIDAPDGLDSAQFIIEQEDGRLGRDVTGLISTSGSLRLSPLREHHFDKMLYNKDKFGFESEVKYIISIDEVENIIGDIDFASLKTDRQTYIEFLVREQNENAILKVNEEINVDIFATKDLRGNDIAPCPTSKILQKAKPVSQTSVWENNNIFKEYATDSLDGDYIMPLLNQTQYDIQNSLSWIDDFDEDTADNFRFIDAQTNLKNVNIKFNIVGTYKYRPEEINTSDVQKVGVLRLTIKYGQTYNTANEITAWVHSFSGHSDQQITIPPEITSFIPNVNNTDKIWIYFRSSSQNAAVNRINIQTTTIEITATSVAYNTVIEGVRLIDAIRQVVKSSSGLNVVSPRLDFGGEYYDQYITTTALMRGLTDKPFNLSFKDIKEKFFPEPFGDYQIQQDGTIYIGFYKDYYPNVLIGDYRDTFLSDSYQIEGYEEFTNERYTANQFLYSYKHYSSQKENEQENTYDEVHGETQWKLANERVENRKEVSVGFIRSAFYIELTRRKSYDLSETAATQDDDKIYIIDTVPVGEERYFTETSTLQHRANGNTVTLTNDQSFSWLRLGIEPGGTFQILTGANAWMYIVISVSDTEIVLERIFSAGGADIDEENTTYRYEVGNNVLIKNRTDEGFTQISNIADGDNYSNLRRTVKRNTIEYYGSYLATCNLYHKDKAIINTLYNNNPYAITRYGDETASIIEGGSFIPVAPILGTNMFKVLIVISLADFLTLRQKVRDDRGYIKFFNPDGLPVTGYIKKASWVFLSNGMGEAQDYVGIMEATVEEKYTPFYMEIFGDGSGLITINGEVTPNTFTFSIDDLGKLSIFDETGKLLHVPVYYDRVKINNSGAAPSAQTLMVWLEALKNEN